MADVMPLLAAEHLSLQMPSQTASRCFPHLLTHPGWFVLPADQSQGNENSLYPFGRQRFRLVKMVPKPPST